MTITIRQASYALRVVRRHAGMAAILYRRTVDDKQQERLTRVTSISPLAFSAATPLLRAAVRAANGNGGALSEGPFYPLDADWGPRVACFARVASGLRNADRLHRAAERLRQADPAEAAWWFGLMQSSATTRTVRALRILLEAVA